MPRLSKAVRHWAFGVRHRCAQPGVLAFNHLPLILLVLWALSASCWAWETPTSTPTLHDPTPGRALALPASCDQGCVIADLDGDGRADIAVVQPEGWAVNGFRYRIDLDLTTRTGPSSFSVFAQQGGLRLTPRDVNGDWELDLVITNAWSLAPVGVWINDGHGTFMRGEPALSPHTLWAEGARIAPDDAHDIFQAAVPEYSNSCPASSFRSSLSEPFTIDRLTFASAAAILAMRTLGPPQLRSPPVSPYK